MERKFRFTFVIKNSLFEETHVIEKVIPENMKYSIARIYERNFLEVLGFEITSVQIEAL